MLETVLKRFEQPDEVRVFEKGKFELVRIGTMTIGRATYEPGWKWSTHVGPTVGASRCNVEHVGLVLSGCATAAMEDGAIRKYPTLPLTILVHAAASMLFNLKPLVETVYGRSPLEDDVIADQADMVVDVIFNGLLNRTPPPKE